MKRLAALLFLLGLLLFAEEARAQRVSALQVGSYLPGVINVRENRKAPSDSLATHKWSLVKVPARP